MKKHLKRIFHIIVYLLAVWGVVSAIALAVGISIDINNNYNVQNSSEEVLRVRHNLNNSENYNYSLVYNVNIPTSWSGHRVNDSNSYVRFTTNSATWVSNNDVGEIYVSFGNSLIIYNDSPLNENYNGLVVATLWDNTQNVCTLTGIYLTNQNGNNFNIYPSSSPLVILCDEIEYSSLHIYPYGGAFNYEQFMSQFFGIYSFEGDNIVIDPQIINPITYYSYEVMGDNTAHHTGSWSGSINLDMVFMSCGHVYKGIKFYYEYVVGTYYNETLTTYNDFTYLALKYIAYKDYLTDDWINVCYPRIYKYETRTFNNVSQLYGYPFTDFTTYLWANEGYKQINVISGGDNVFSTSVGDPIANLTNIQVLTYKGELNNNVYVSGNNGTNVFNLLSYGFTSVIPLFAITLLPGLTIGTLLFLPLVVTIIFAIIKILRK